MTSQGLRIVVVGGGSAYTGELLTGLLARTELDLDRIALVDVPAGRDKVEAVVDFAKRLASRLGRRVDLIADATGRYDFTGADFVLTQYRVGGLVARSADEHIALAHGVVGQETVGPGGFAKALRTVPVAVEMAERIRDDAPDAWILNFTNPSGIITEAIRKGAGARVLGLCNGPYSLRRMVATALEVAVERVSLDVVGLNHLSFARVFVDGRDITPAALGLDQGVSAAVRELPEIASNRYGTAVAAELGRVPSDYLKYYWQGRRMLEQQRAAVASGEGTRADHLIRLEPTLFDHYRGTSLDLPPALSERGGAYYSTVAVELLTALALNRQTESVVNMKNGTVIPELPTDAVIEVSALIDGRGARALAVGPLPPMVQGLVRQVKAYESLTVEAALSGSKPKAVAALTANPLVADHDLAEAILADILEAHSAYLPRFSR
jgi:6-phospho-beta-glucosidase